MSGAPDAGRGGGEAPVFVVGAGRSGTTLARLILNAHPRIAIPDESALLVKVYDRFRGGESWPRVVDSAMDLVRERFRPPIELTGIRAELLALPAPDFGALMELPLRAWARNEGKERWGEKTPEHIFYSEPILEMFPEARFVEMIRDPRAVVASMTRSEFKADDPTRNAMYWNYVIDTAHAALHRNAPSDHVFTVRYETLVTAPEATVREICAFLGEEFDPAMLAFHERSRSYLSHARSEGDAKLGQGVSADLDGWRAELSDGRLAITEEVCGANMERLGYARAGRPVRLAERTRIAANLGYVAWKHHQQRDRHFHRFTGPVAGRLRRLTRRAPGR